MAKPLNLVGQTFGKLTVIKRNGSTDQNKAKWLCKCSCGNITSVISSPLKSGHVKSCGCARNESSKQTGTKLRTINYQSLVCSTCGSDESNRFINSDNTIVKHTTHNKIKNIMCNECRNNVSRVNGRIKSEMNSSIEVSSIHKQVILGSILGDGHLEKSPCVNGEYGLSVKHGLKQKSYCLWKAFILGNLITKIDYPSERVRFRTIKHSSISSIARTCILGKKKIITEDFIKLIKPMALAIWYLDDGCYTKSSKSKNGYFRKHEIRFATNAFSEAEDTIIKNKLKSMLDIKSTKCSWKNKKCFGINLDEPRYYHGIRLYGDNVTKFLRCIDDLVDWNKSGMSYKRLPSSY